MSDYDIFNGDADGICALLQLRLAEPRQSTLITGVKRDIALLKQVSVQAGDRLTVLDVSMDKNKDALNAALDAGGEVFYCDHHFAGDIPQHPALNALINTESEVCTALLINGHLKGQFAEWAVVGAFGDNLGNSARAAAKPIGLSEAHLESYENLGIYINYNGYGASLEDLHLRPADLYQAMLPYASPSDFMNDATETFGKLEQGYHEDMASARNLKPHWANSHAAAFILPEAAWARRVSGVYSNELANQSPARAHAVLTEKADGNYLISVRAPLERRTGADELCRQFATGGGRAAAAGVNDLPADQLDAFIDALDRQFAI